MASKPDYFEILGVKRSSSLDEIRRSYRKLAIRYHPDRNPNDKKSEARFKEISQAYDTLSDPVKRKRYEEVDLAPPPPPPNYPVMADLYVEVELDAKDHKNGADKTVTVSRPRVCPDCSGSGRINARFQSRCQLCMGAGCQPCEWTGRVTFCARCWGRGEDKETTLITVRVPSGMPPYGRHKLVANGNLWGKVGPFYVFANISVKVHKPGLIMR